MGLRYCLKGLTKVIKGNPLINRKIIPLILIAISIIKQHTLTAPILIKGLNWVLLLRLRITESELGGRKTKARANQGLRPQDKLGYRLFDQDTIH